jgi:mannose/fructose/N-acetylgalactosamine-specific phosphotransferase system component IID
MGIKKLWLRLKRKWRVCFKEDFKPASNRLQKIDHWATILGLFVSSYFAWKSIDLTLSQAEHKFKKTVFRKN